MLNLFCNALLRNLSFLPVTISFCVLCIVTHLTHASIIDVELSGHLNSNPLLKYAVRYRVDTTAQASSSDIDLSSWSSNGTNGSPFLLKMDGHVNNIKFNLDQADLQSSNASQLLLIGNSKPGIGNGDNFVMGANVAGSGSITGSDFRLRQPDGDSSLIGTSIPISSKELNLSTFSSYEFFYHNSNNQVRSGTIDTLNVTIVPGPGGLAALSLISLSGLGKRRRINASPS